jgi:hypothetical protein
MGILQELENLINRGGEVPSAQVGLAPKTLAPVPVEQSGGSRINSQTRVPEVVVPSIKNNSGPVRQLQESRGLLSDNPNSYGSNDELETAMQQTKGSPTGAVLRGVNYGLNTATGQNEKGMMDGFMGGVTSLLGNIDVNKLFRIMANPALQQGSMGQEANVGQNLIRRLVEANANVNQQDALAAQSGEDNNLAAFKAETARLKEQKTTSPKFSSEIIKLYKQNESYGQSLTAIADAKKYINGAYAGVAGDAKGALVGMARFFGADIEMTDSESIEDAANRVKAAIIGSGMFGRETSSKELKLLDKLVLQISTLKGKDQVLNSFEQLTKTFQGNMQLNTDLLRAAGFQSRSDMARPGGLISKRGN